MLLKLTKGQSKYTKMMHATGFISNVGNWEVSMFWPFYRRFIDLLTSSRQEIPLMSQIPDLSIQETSEPCQELRKSLHHKHREIKLHVGQHHSLKLEEIVEER